eukprot:2438050-Rhodomonas_salina.1
MKVSGIRRGGLLLCLLVAVHIAAVGAGPFDWARKLARTLTGQLEVGGDGTNVAHSQRALLWAHTAKYSSIQPVRGLVLGWDTVTVRGMGFQSNVSYELVFTDSINSSLSAGVHEWLSETTMTFLTPVWSDLYVAAQTQVTLAAGGSDIDLDNSSSTLLYSFDPLWFPETFTPTIGLAEGGTRVTLSGV